MWNVMRREYMRVVLVILTFASEYRVFLFFVCHGSARVIVSHKVECEITEGALCFVVVRNLIYNFDLETDQQEDPCQVSNR